MSDDSRDFENRFVQLFPLVELDQHITVEPVPDLVPLKASHEHRPLFELVGERERRVFEQIYKLVVFRKFDYCLVILERPHPRVQLPPLQLPLYF